MSKSGTAPRRIKVCHLTSVHPAEDVRIFWKECRTLAAAGYEVVLIAAQGAAREVDGVIIKVVPAAGSGRLTRMTRTVWRVYQAAKAERAAIYHLHDPELLSIAWLLRLGGAEVIYDMHELLPSQILSKTWIARWARRALSTIVAAGERLVLRGMPTIFASTIMSEPYCYIRRSALVANMPRHEDFPCRPWQARRDAVVYIGGVSTARGSTVMVGAMQELWQKGREIDFICIGRIADEHLQELRRMGAAGGDRLEIEGLMSASLAYERASLGKVGLVLLTPNEYYGLGAIPTKLLEYMMMGMAVIATDMPSYRAVIEAAQCGLLVDPSNRDEVLTAIDSYFLDDSVARSAGERGRRYAMENFNWASEAVTLVGFYERLLARA